MVMGSTFVTYRRLDGQLVYGEFMFVTEYEGLEDEDCDIIKECWVLESRSIIPRIDPYLEYEAEYEDLEPISKIVRKEESEL